MTIRILACVILTAGMTWADEAVYLMRGPDLPVPRSVNGYSIEVRHRAAGDSAEVRVETSLDPVGSSGSLAEVRAAGRPPVPAGFELPSSLRSDVRLDMTAWDAATTVLRWVSDHLALVEDDAHPQDAVSVLRRGGGRCSGLANATTALLMAAGFEARTVSGLLITARRTIPHRWVECRLPGAGWVPTDPTLGWWTITPGHVAFADAVTRAPEIDVVIPASGELRRLPRIGAVVVRPNHGAELVCRFRGTTEGQIVVASLQRGSDRRQAVLDPEVRFKSLIPGRWLLIVEVGDRVVERRELTLKAGSVHSYVVRIPAYHPEKVGS